MAKVRKSKKETEEVKVVVKEVVIQEKYYQNVPQNDRDGKGKFEYTNSSH